MHSTFNIVIWVVCVLAVLISLAALIFSGKTWEDFGKGRLVMDCDSAQHSRTGSGMTTT